ncbi:hypothetical protein B5M47_01755 [candidate division CPR3 bacterium 4484_211]|uniref:Polysaccharide biosynthesis protein C-terminal domain-containing protein n=1 Tax=candidate division CPR3 bacterium 4484_211 TaxID=1968527 RepID=A0A1W9NYB7_UNCC3|nr:MAG: hypothetical protein B5M47_01755 [candidate division CPR3 bacterium 4484_211]
MKKSYFTVASNTIFQILGRFSTALIALVVTRLITGYLGIDGFGEYQIVLSYVTFLWVLVDFGFNAIAVRRMSSHPEQEQSVFTTLLSAKLFLSFLAAVFLAGISFFLPYTLTVKLGIALGSITILSQGLRGACSGLFQYKLRYDVQFLSELLSGIVFLGLVVFTLKNGAGLLGIVAALVVQYLLVALISAFFAARWLSLKPRFNPGKIKELALEAFPFGIALLFSLMTGKVDTFLLSVLPQEEISQVQAVGYFGLSLKIFEFVLAVPVFFMNVVYPILARNLSLKWEYFTATFKKSFLILFNMGMWGSMLLYIAAPYFVNIVAKDVRAGPAVHILRILTLFIPIYFITALLMWVQLVFKKQKSLIFVYAAAFVFAFVSNCLFVPRYSYTAAALIKGLTEVFIFLQLSYLTLRNFRERLTTSSSQ